MATEPYEIVVSPFTVYLAATGSTFPDTDETPSAPWDSLGQSGSQDLNESGVVITHDQTINRHRFLGGTGARKATRSSEDLMVAFTLHDLSLEEYAKIMDNATVTDTAASSGVPGERDIKLYLGRDVYLWALMAKGDSPYGNGWSMQYEVPVCFRDGNPAPVFNKNEPAGLAFQFAALEDPNAASESARFGQLVAQDDDAA